MREIRDVVYMGTDTRYSTGTSVGNNFYMYTHVRRSNKRR